MLDNGAFSKWKSAKETNWPEFYKWVEPWLGYPTTWAVIPDVIDGGSQMQDALVREWPFGHKGAPVLRSANLSKVTQISRRYSGNVGSRRKRFPSFSEVQ